MDTLKSGMTAFRQKSNSKAKKGSEYIKKPSRSKGKVSCDKLVGLYKQLCTIVEGDQADADAKLQDISKMFSQYVRLVKKINTRRAEKFKGDEVEC